MAATTDARRCMGTKCMWSVIGAAALLLFIFVGMQGTGHFTPSLSRLAAGNYPGIETQYVYEFEYGYERRWKMLSNSKHVRPITGDDEDTRMRYPTVTKSLIIRSVYYDPRPRVPGHDNATVFLVAGSKEILAGGLLVKCQLGSTVTSSLAVRILEEGSLSHKEALVDCYDLPVEGTGIRAFLYYQESVSDDQLYTAESEKPFQHVTSMGLLSSYSCNSTADNCYNAPVSEPPTVVACVAMLYYGNPQREEYRLFYKWLDHLEGIGVKHVHILAEHSFLAREGFANPYIFSAVKKYFLSVIFWQSFLNDTDVKNHSKVLAYNDCLYRYIGLYDYILLLDWNYFFLPHMTSNSSLLEECDSESGCKFGTQRGTVPCAKDGTPETVGGEEESEDKDGPPVFLQRLDYMESVGWVTEGTSWTPHKLTPSSAVFKKLKCSK